MPASPRVFVHYSASGATDAALAQSLAERLRQEGFAVAGVRAVPFSIGAGSVRYFFAGDLGEARRLLASFNDYLGRQARPAARGPVDFTRFDPKPMPGTIELWITGR